MMITFFKYIFKKLSFRIASKEAIPTELLLAFTIVEPPLTIASNFANCFLFGDMLYQRNARVRYIPCTL